MKLWLLRHARVVLPTGLCYGASDVAARDTGTPADETEDLTLSAVAQPEGQASPPARKRTNRKRAPDAP